MSVAKALLDRLTARHITATVTADGHVHLDGPAIPDQARDLVAKHEIPLRGLLAHQTYLQGGDPAAWCHRCGTDVAQFSADGTAWCDRCVIANAAHLLEALDEPQQKEVTSDPTLFPK